MRNEPAFRRSEPDARRQSLIEACARVLAKAGANGASVRAVAAEAGVSAGLVGHYFTGIDGLVSETYYHVGALVDAALEQAVAAAEGPRARLEAFVTASFRPPIADRHLLATWIAFWSLVTSRSEIAQRHDEQYASFRGRIEGLLADCGISTQKQRHAAIAITALVDGLWLELCLSPGCFSPDEAAAIACEQLAAITAMNG